MTDREELNRVSNLEEYYEPLEQVNDPRFGTIIIFANKYNSSDLIFAKEKLSHNLNDCERDIFQAKERMRLSHDFLIKMIDFSTKSFESETPDHEKDYLVTGFYEYPTHDLASEIVERQKQGRHFSGEELLQLEINLLEVLNYLKSSKMIHGDIRPKYIFFDRSEKGYHKLVDRLGDPSPPNQVQVNNIRRREPLYMSPALYRALSNKQVKIKHNPFKSDAFSLGLVILECGVLKSVQSIYQDKDINLDRLLELLEEFISIYDNHTILKESLMWLLDTEEKERKDPKKILRMIKEMQEEAARAIVQNFNQQQETADDQINEQNKMEIVELDIVEGENSPVISVPNQRFEFEQNTRNVQAQATTSNTETIQNQRNMASNAYQLNKFTVEEQNFQLAQTTNLNAEAEKKIVEEQKVVQNVHQELTNANSYADKIQATSKTTTQVYSTKIPERISSEEYVKETIGNNVYRQTAPGYITDSNQTNTNQTTGQSTTQTEQRTLINQINLSSAHYVNVQNNQSVKQSSQDQIQEVNIEIARPVVSHPAQHYDRSNLKFGFEHPPTVVQNQTITSNDKQQALGQGSTGSLDQQTFQAMQNRTTEQRQSENQYQSQLKSVVSRSSNVSGQPIRYQLGQTITDYKPVVVQENVSLDQFSYKPTFSQVNRIQVTSNQTQTTPSLIPRHVAQTNTVQQQTSTELKTIESQQSSKQELNRNEIVSPNLQTELASPKPVSTIPISNSSANLYESQKAVKTESSIKVQKDELTKQSSQTQISTFENANIRPVSAYQSGNNLTRNESSQYIKSYTANYAYPTQQVTGYTSQAYTSQLPVNVSNSNVVYRRINADGKLVTSTSGPNAPQYLPTSTIHYSTNNDVIRNYSSQGNQPLPSQYESVNNYSTYNTNSQTHTSNVNVVNDHKSVIQTNTENYIRHQSVVEPKPVIRQQENTGVDNVSAQVISKNTNPYRVAYPSDQSHVQNYSSIRTFTTNANEKQVQVPSEQRIDSKVFDYEVQQADDGSKRYIIRRNPSQNLTTRHENGYQVSSVNHSPMVYNPQTYITQTVTQPISYAKNPTITSTEHKTTDNKLQADADSNFKVVRVLKSNQEITEHRHVFQTPQVSNVSQYQSNYVANQVRPSATFVNAIIPDISHRQQI